MTSQSPRDAGTPTDSSSLSPSRGVVSHSDLSGHNTDSDVSDNEGTFSATFEPRVNDAASEDSGIALVSYHKKHKSPDRSGARSGSKGSEEGGSAVLISSRPLESAEYSGASYMDLYGPKAGVRSPPEPTSPPHGRKLSGGGLNPGSAVYPRVGELQYSASSPPDSHSPSPPPLPGTEPPTGAPAGGRSYRSDSDSAGEGSSTIGSPWRESATQPSTGGVHYANSNQLSSNSGEHDRYKNIASKSGSLIYDSSWDPKSGSSASVTGSKGVHSRVGREPSGYTMDPITGLKRTGYASPSDKAMLFAQATEPQIRIKKKEDGSLNTDAERERLNILDEMRVKKKKSEHWLPEDEIPKTNVEKTQSERAYEERRAHVKEKEKEYQVQHPTIMDTRPREKGMYKLIFIIFLLTNSAKYKLLKLFYLKEVFQF